jgi:hypothetical protein
MEDGQVEWKAVGLDPPSLQAAMLNECRLNGDRLMTWAEFWNFCLLNGTGHAVDPAEQAKHYLMVRATPASSGHVQADYIQGKTSSPKSPHAFLWLSL